MNSLWHTDLVANTDGIYIHVFGCCVLCCFMLPHLQSRRMKVALAIKQCLCSIDRGPVRCFKETLLSGAIGLGNLTVIITSVTSKQTRVSYITGFRNFRLCIALLAFFLFWISASFQCVQVALDIKMDVVNRSDRRNCALRVF